jgi:hypothetical protein
LYGPANGNRNAAYSQHLTGHLCMIGSLVSVIVPIATRW